MEKVVFLDRDGVISKDSPDHIKSWDEFHFLPNAKVVIGRKDTKISSINDLKRLTGVTSKGSSYEHALNQNNIKDFYYNSGKYSKIEKR